MINQIKTSNTQQKQTLFTIGYQGHTVISFIKLLKTFNINAIADVRSSPFSKYNQEFNIDTLKKSLFSTGIRYVFLGNQLGARPSNTSTYTLGKVDFSKLAHDTNFKEGLERIIRGSESYRIAMMCAEKDPLMCHRTILIAKNLKDHLNIIHILDNGETETHTLTENRLIKYFSYDQNILPGLSIDTSLESAYKKQSELISYSQDGDG